MQSIERYGVVALLLLVVTVVAVLVWDEAAVDASGPEPELPEIAALPEVQKSRFEVREGREPQEKRLSLAAPPTARPLAREPEAESEGREDEALLLPGEMRDVDDVWRRGEGSRDGSRAGETARAGIVAGRDGARSGGTEPPATASAGPNRSDQRIYVVQASDTLSQISQTHLGTYKRWKEILALNPGLDPNRMHAGTRLVLPGEGSAPSTSSQPVARRDAAPAAKEVAGTTTYRVRQGDSLWKISARLLGDGKRWRELLELNPKLDPDKIHAGIAIVVPEAASRERAPVAGSSQPSSSGRLIATNTGTDDDGRVR